MAFLSLVPGSDLAARQQQYDKLLGADGQIGARYTAAADQASRRIAGDVASTTQGQSPLLAGRQAASAGRDVHSQLLSQGIQAQNQAHQRALTMAREDLQRQSDLERNAIGNLIGGGGQLLGSVLGMVGGGPAGSQLGSSIGGGLGNMLGGIVRGDQGGGSGGNPLGGLMGGTPNPQSAQTGGNPLSSIPILGSLLGGGGQQAQQQAQQPQTTQASGNPLSSIPILGSLMGAGGQSQPSSPSSPSSAPAQTVSPVPGATQRMGPDGQMHWFDANGNIVG